jgi:hypothetical protein
VSLSREQDVEFAERVAGWKNIHGVPVHAGYAGKAPWSAYDGEEEYVSYYSSDTSRVVGMMRAIEELCGDDSIVTLWLENGRYCATVSWFPSRRYFQSKNCGDGTANGALVALGLAVADTVHNLHEEVE